MAAARLRRRLSPSMPAPRAAESFVVLGTPLPPLDSRRADPNEGRPLWEQEVRDEQGRRRLHGAFTGGFSAGYFNTVGSREGWTPQQFRSSRRDGDRSSSGAAARPQQTAEDFMDDEDREALRGQLAVAHSYGGAAAAPQERGAAYDPLLGALGLPPTATGGDGTAAGGSGDGVVAARSALGERLLTRMGWTAGSGLGPRVSPARHAALVQLAGLPRTAALQLDEGARIAAATHGVPPPDSRLVAADAWSGRRGLGAAPGQPALQGLRDGPQHLLGKGTAVSRDDRGGGFGLGALEEDSDGEDEMYAARDSIHSSTLGQTQARRPAPGDQARAGGSDVQPRSDSDSRWSDGSFVLKGFRVSDSVQGRKEHLYAPPSVPKDWSPDPQRVWAVDAAGAAKPEASASQGAPPTKDSAPAAMASALRPDDRASILGEARIPGPPPSIMNYLSAKDRERLQRVKAESEAGPSALAPVRPPSPEPVVALEVPSLDRVTANAALRGYMPFADNPAKQERYRSYLSAQANPAEAPPLTVPAGQSVEASNAELREFNKSAGIFRPMSVAMSSRFTSSSAPSGVPATDAPIVAGGLYQPTPKPAVERADLRKPAPEPEETEILTDAQQAARSGMFGPLTRSTSSWAPEKLLCKRFGVPPPSSTLHEASATTGAPSGVNAHWEANRHELEQMAKGWSGNAAGSMAPNAAATALPTAFGAAPESTGPTAHASSSSQHVPGKPAARSLETIGLGEDEDQGRETLTYVRPPIDIFKAVFASDDEDDGDEAPARPLAAKAAAPAAPRSAAAPQPAAVDVAPRAGPDASDPSNAFRPAFVPRAKRTAAGVGSGSDDDSKAGKQGAKREKKRKKDKDKRPKGMLTFSVDDE